MYLLTAYTVLLAFLSLNSKIVLDSSPAIGIISWDMLDHAAAYGVLAVLLMVTFKRRQQQWASSLSVLLMCGLMGILFEYCQLWFTSTRQFSYYDAVANVFGAVLGVALFWCYSFVAVKRAN